jgi:hypothetical protein
MHEYKEMVLELPLKSTCKFALFQPTSILYEYLIDIMMYCVNEIKENLMAYKTYEYLYHHKLKAYVQVFPNTTYMPPHQGFQSLRSTSSPTFSQPRSTKL